MIVIVLLIPALRGWFSSCCIGLMFAEYLTCTVCACLASSTTNPLSQVGPRRETRHGFLVSSPIQSQNLVLQSIPFSLFHLSRYLSPLRPPFRSPSKKPFNGSMVLVTNGVNYNRSPHQPKNHRILLVVAGLIAAPHVRSLHG